MISGILFILMRCVELFFLIPALGMLSEIVHVYLTANEVTPAFVLVLFIVVVLASVWVLLTLFFYNVAKYNGYFVALVDLGFFGALIAGVVVAGGISGQSCSNYSITSNIYKESGIWVYQFGEFCNLLKASFAFAIMEIIFFFVTTLLALWVHHHHRNDDRNRDRGTSSRSEKHYSRHSQRRSRSANGGGGGSRDYTSRVSRYDDRSRRGASRSRNSPSRSYV